MDDRVPELGRDLDRDRENWIDPLLEAFQLGGLMQRQQLHSGLLQQTWRLETQIGKFIAQKLHPIFSEGVTEDGQIISTYLHTQGFPTPEYLTTQSGDLHLHLGSDRWRVMTCLPGSTHATPPTWDHLRQVGATVGRLHQVLANFEHEFRFQIPHFHDTPYLWRKLQNLSHRFNSSHEAVAAQFYLETLPDLFLPEDLPQQIIHGDLKIVNFLFDDQGNVTGILDLDTLMNHSLYVEMGDALRSWTKRGHTIDLEALNAGLIGYQESGALEQLDLELLLRGYKLITLELGMRFLIDVSEDYYFAWDPQRYPSRKAHNLERCQRQIHLFKEIQRQADQIESLLRSL